MRKPIVVGGETIKAGERKTVKISVARLYTHTQLDTSVHVIHGRRSGPRLFVSAALHGDEINGVEIIRRLLKLKSLNSLCGTLLAVPVVNAFGFINHSRYLPDRRDLNRSFPGNDNGSLTSRLASLFMQEVALKCTHGIDLHTGSNHRTNLPQIRAFLDHTETRLMASAFGTRVILNAKLRDGSLRQAVMEKKIPMLLYEAGESLRFDNHCIHIGVRGVINVMQYLGMLPERFTRKSSSLPCCGNSSTWVRMPRSGLLISHKQLGARVEKNDVLGIISDPFGEREVKVRSHAAGIIIGHTNLPLVYKGDGAFHIMRTEGELPDEDINQDPMIEELDEVFFQ